MRALKKDAFDLHLRWCLCLSYLDFEWGNTWVSGLMATTTGELHGFDITWNNRLCSRNQSSPISKPISVCQLLSPDIQSWWMFHAAFSSRWGRSETITCIYWILFVPCLSIWNLPLFLLFQLRGYFSRSSCTKSATPLFSSLKRNLYLLIFKYKVDHKVVSSVLHFISSTQGPSKRIQ